MQPTLKIYYLLTINNIFNLSNIGLPASYSAALGLRRIEIFRCTWFS